jgi:alpha-N-arabinofuranosidase
VPLLDAVAVHDADGGVLTIFAVNRDQQEPLMLDADLRALPDLVLGRHTVIADEDPDAINTAESADRVIPRRLDDLMVDGGRVRVALPALSWSMIRLSEAVD